MSYSRWSNSSWYSFYNVNGNLSLWYDMDHIIDFTYDEVAYMLEQEDKIPEFLKSVYECTEEEAIEAIQYMKYFAEDYDPKDGEEYNKELSELMQKLEGTKDES